MTLKRLDDIDLPDHVGQGGFDHAAIDRSRALLYVAHTANDAVDVIDTRTGRHVRSISGLRGVAGVVVHEGEGTVFTSNRGEDSVGILGPESLVVTKVAVGRRPNGLAYDPVRGLLLCASVGDPADPGSWTASIIDIRARRLLIAAALPGRPRWAVFDPEPGRFLVNIAEPAQIVVMSSDPPGVITQRFLVPGRGPHGLDLDPAQGRLYCACDGGQLVALDSRTGAVVGSLALSGPPDVIFLSHSRRRLYVAIGDPGVVDVIDVAAWERTEVVATGPGAHTIAWDEDSGRLYAFLPLTHRAAVFHESGARGGVASER